MNSTRKLVVLALGLIALIAACEDDVVVDKPPQDEQIETSVTYVRSTDDDGQPNGLPDNNVYDFITVSNGEFWVGTEAGVARFASITAFTLSQDDIVNGINGLPHPIVKTFAEYGGKVYVGTWGGGLGVYDIGTDAWTQITPSEDGLVDGFVSEITVSPTEDRLYMATNNGVSIYNPTAETFTHENTVDQDLLDTPPGDLSTAERDAVKLQALVSSVEVTEDAGVVQRWYGPRVETTVSDQVLERVGILVSKSAATEYRYTKMNSGLIEPNVNDIYYDAVRGTYWVSYVTKGLSEVNLTTRAWTNNTLVQGLPSNTVYSVTRAGIPGGSGTTLWAATQGGLARLVGTHWQAYGVSSGLPSDRPRRVYSDNGQRLWVAFVNGGAVRIQI